MAGIIDLSAHLPIRLQKSESDYIEHLWQVYYGLDSAENTAVAYKIMPYHLLFMLALHYKVLRITGVSTHKTSIDLFLKTGGGRDTHRLKLEDLSVADISLVNERTIPELFNLIGLDREDIRIIKSIVDYRNNTLGHPKLVIESDPEVRIEQYNTAILKVAECFKELNIKIARDAFIGLAEDDDITILLDEIFLSQGITYYDFGDMILDLLETESLTFEQWQALTLKGIEFCEPQLISALTKIAINGIDSDNRFNAIQTLDTNNSLDKYLVSKILSIDKDSEIINYLKNK